MTFVAFEGEQAIAFQEVCQERDLAILRAERAESSLALALTALEPFAEWSRHELENHIPANILRCDVTPVLGRAIGEGGMAGEVTVGDLRRAAACPLKAPQQEDSNEP